MAYVFRFVSSLILFALLLPQAIACSQYDEASVSDGYLVPVAHLASGLEDFDPKLGAGQSLAVPERFADEARGATSGEIRAYPDGEAVIQHIGRTPSAVGLVPWRSVDSSVRVLTVEGEDPMDAPRDYPLAFGDAEAPKPDMVRRVVIGGDIVLDRGLPYAVYQLGYGPDFPMSGGYAEVTSRTPVASEFSQYGVIHEFTATRTGDAGAVRGFLSGADLTLANLENPVLQYATYHPEGTVFEGDLSLLPVLTEAGIDGVTLSNNHILDAGEAGLYETISHLDDAGMSHTGAGENLDSARKPMIFDLGGTSVGVLGYQNVPTYEWARATEDSFGTAPLTEKMLRRDIGRLKEEVDTVIVMPHWGEEYTATPEPEQVSLARAAVDAGADAVVGGHAHWVKGMEVYEGSPVYYGVGNFLFDQVWSEETSTGIFVELTLYDGEIVQSKPIPYIVLDYGQPNFLTPEGGGDSALDALYAASVGPEFGRSSP